MFLPEAIEGWRSSLDPQHLTESVRQLADIVGDSPFATTPVEAMTSEQLADLADQCDDPRLAGEHLDAVAAWARGESQSTNHRDTTARDTDDRDTNDRDTNENDLDNDGAADDEVSPWKMWAAVLGVGVVALLAVALINRPSADEPDVADAVEEIQDFAPAPAAPLDASTDGVVVAHESGNMHVIGIDAGDNPDGLAPWWPLFNGSNRGAVTTVSSAGDVIGITTDAGNAWTIDTAQASTETQIWDGSGDKRNAIEIAVGTSLSAIRLGNGSIEIDDPSNSDATQLIWDGATSQPAVDVAMAGDIVIFVLRNGNVRTWTPTGPEDARGKLLWNAANAPNATSVAADTDFVIFTLDNGNARVQHLDRAGLEATSLAWFGEGDLPDAVSVAAWSKLASFTLNNGNAWVYDAEAPEGERQTLIWRGEGDRADAVAIAARNDLSIVVLENGHIRSWNPALPNGERSTVIARTTRGDSNVVSATLLD